MFGDWLSPEASLAGLFAYSFLAATLLPGGSEIALFAYLRAEIDRAAERVKSEAS